MPSDGIVAGGRATLFDGASARDHSVAVTVAAGRLVIVPDDAAEPPRVPLIWILSDCHETAEGRADRLTVATRVAPDARLVIVDPALRAALEPRLSRAAPRTGERRSAVRWAIGLGVAVVLIVTAAGLTARHAAQFLPVGWGGRLSDAMLEQLTDVYAACDGTAGAAALDRLAAGMAATLGVPEPKVTTVRWDLVNAFALPGGRVVLTSGLIERADEPPAVAAVLAHEIGHVARRDPLARMLREKLVDVALAAVFGVTIDVGTTGAVAGFVLDNTYTRDQELGADAMALRVLNDLDIDAGPGARFFDQLAENEGGLDAVTLLRSHPLSADRAERLRRHGTGRGPGLTPREWQAVRSICG